MSSSPAPVIETLPPLATKAKAAWIASVSERQVDKLVAEGLFPPYVIVGKSRRWRSAEIIAWSDAGCPAMSDWQWPPPPSPKELSRNEICSGTQREFRPP